MQESKKKLDKRSKSGYINTKINIFVIVCQSGQGNKQKEVVLLWKLT